MPNRSEARGISGHSPQCRGMLVAALGYAAQGLLVFPLAPNRKPIKNCGQCPKGAHRPGQCPCPVDTCHGFYAATSDRGKIRRWWTAHPEWGIGIRTGKGSDLVVLDVDLRSGGLESLKAMERAGFNHTGCGLQHSGSGQSFHLLFRYGTGQVRNTQGRVGNPDAGLDLRAEGGFVVAAPTLHPSTGRPYEMIGPVRNLPPWPGFPPGFRKSGKPSTPRKAATGGAHESGGPGAWTAHEARQQPCDRVEAVLQDFEEGTGGHHPRLLTSVTMLLRMRQQGHRGVATALDLLRDSFLSRVVRGEGVAAAEFDRVVADAWSAMHEPVQPKRDAVCSCLIELRRAQVTSGEVLDRGRARSNQQEVMRALLLLAEQQQSARVRGWSQRRLGTSIGLGAASTNRVLGRLRELGLIDYETAQGVASQNSYLINFWFERRQQRRTKPAGTSSVVTRRVTPHPLFSQGGLGAAVAETFARLAEKSMRLTRGHAVRIPKDVAVTELLLSPYRATRRIPVPAPSGGQTADQLAHLRELSVSQVHCHLSELAQHGLAFSERGVWSRYRFDPDLVVEAAGFEDTVERLKAAHDAEGRQRGEQLCLKADRNGEPIAIRRVTGDRGQIVVRDSQTVIWDGPLPADWSDKEASDVG